MIARRGLLRAAIGLLAAPAVVRVAAIMPVKALPAIDDPFLRLFSEEVLREFRRRTAFA